jgi:hypothetical protein
MIFIACVYLYLLFLLKSDSLREPREEKKREREGEREREREEKNTRSMRAIHFFQSCTQECEFIYSLTCKLLSFLFF